MRTLKRLRLYEMSSTLTPQIRRKLTYIWKHEDDENFREIYHLNSLHILLEEWMDDIGVRPDYEREPTKFDFVVKCIIEEDTGRKGHLTIDGEPGEWVALLDYTKEGGPVFGFEEVTVYDVRDKMIQDKSYLFVFCPRCEVWIPWEKFNFEDGTHEDCDKYFKNLEVRKAAERRVIG